MLQFRRGTFGKQKVQSGFPAKKALCPHGAVIPAGDHGFIAAFIYLGSFHASALCSEGTDGGRI